MAKRLTKAKRESQQRARLYERVCDIMAGVQGEDPTGECFFVTVAKLPELLEAVKLRLLPSDLESNNLNHLVSYWNLDEYETAEKLTDFLFRNGIR